MRGMVRLVKKAMIDRSETENDVEEITEIKLELKKVKLKMMKMEMKKKLKINLSGRRNENDDDVKGMKMEIRKMKKDIKEMKKQEEIMEAQKSKIIDKAENQFQELIELVESRNAEHKNRLWCFVDKIDANGIGTIIRVPNFSDFFRGDWWPEDNTFCQEMSVSCFERSNINLSEAKEVTERMKMEIRKLNEDIKEMQKKEEIMEAQNSKMMEKAENLFKDVEGIKEEIVKAHNPQNLCIVQKWNPDGSRGPIEAHDFIDYFGCWMA